MDSVDVFENNGEPPLLRSSHTMSKTQIAYLLAGIAIGLRLASDWIFRQGGPFSYQLVQAFFLLLAIAFLAPQWHEVFLAKGRFRSALKIALWAAPIGLLMGIGDAILSYGRLYWPSWNQIILPIANNLFFPAVEELEFRGFALSWLFKKKIGKPLVIALIVTISSLAHAHRFWVIDLRAWFFVIALNLFWTWLVARTQCLWGGYIAHSLWNIFVGLPLYGLGINIR